MHIVEATHISASSTIMRPYKPAPKNKNASANRIRERYLHQLGLQRGGAPLISPHLSQTNQHVVVISGLPSLPEDRATTEHVMESHDFSISSKVSRHTRHTDASGGSSLGENDDAMSDIGSACYGTHHSQCSKSTLSISPNREAGEAMTSMALAYPTALSKMPRPAEPTPPPINNNTLPFSLSNPVSWRSTSLSKLATVLLDSAGCDHDSVSSVGTSTTAETSLTGAMVTRDWGAIPHIASAGVSVSSSQLGESPSSTPGVYFQCGHPRLLGSHVQVAQASSGQCATSSLAHALNRFNIDSDCEMSAASNSIMEDQIMDDDDASLDDTASRCSVASHTSAGSNKSQLSSASHSIRASGRRKKIGKKAFMDRAAAHERILQIRNDRSHKMRANVVHSQRMNNQVSISGLSSAMAQEGHQLSESPGSTTSSQASILMHVNHGSSSQATTPVHEKHPLHHSMGADLGRTPTASNCSDLRRLKALGPPAEYINSLPPGVHLLSKGVMQPYLPGPGVSRKSAPLGFHPQLASGLPRPSPNVNANMVIINNSTPDQVSEPSLAEADVETREMEHVNHNPTVYDVMEVAMTLSKLGGARTGPVPRIR